MSPKAPNQTPHPPGGAQDPPAGPSSHQLDSGAATCPSCPSWTPRAAATPLLSPGRPRHLGSLRAELEPIPLSLGFGNAQPSRPRSRWNTQGGQGHHRDTPGALDPGEGGIWEERRRFRRCPWTHLGCRDPNTDFPLSSVSLLPVNSSGAFPALPLPADMEPRARRKPSLTLSLPKIPPASQFPAPHPMDSTGTRPSLRSQSRD